MPKAFIITIEGTLVDCLHQQFACWRDQLALSSIYIPATTLMRYAGMPGERMLRELQSDLNDQQRQVFTNAYTMRFERHFLNSVRPIRGAVGILNALKAQSKVVFVSSSSGATLDYYRALLKLKSATDIIIAAESAAPDRNPVAAAIQKLRVDPKDVTVVASTIHDARAALAAGATCVGVVGAGFQGRELLGAGCQDVLVRLADVLSPPSTPFVNTGRFGANCRERA